MTPPTSNSEASSVVTDAAADRMHQPPLAASSAAIEPDLAAAGAAPITGPSVAPAILVVDDNAAKRMAFRAMLAPLGTSVIEVDSGREALRAVRRQTFALILLDVRMPTLDGFETAKLIRQQPDSALTPIMFVTAYGGDEAETVTAYASGAVDFIFLPIIPEVLRAKVLAFVEMFVQAQELRSSVETVTDLNAALRASEVRARAVLQNVADGIVTAGEGGLIESFNQAAVQLLGYHEDEVIGQPLALIVAPSHRDEFSASAQAKWSLLDAPSILAESAETVGRSKDGRCFPMEMGISQMRIGEETFTIVCVRDISVRKAYTHVLEQRMLHDDLTGLPNRTLFADRLDSAVAAADRAGESRAVLLLNLDRFGKINEELGTEKGDALLQGVAGRLRGARRDSDTVCRLGGDSFAILPAGETDLEAAAAIAWKVQEVFEHPFLITGDSVEVRASIGIAFFPQHGRASGDLLRRADRAMHGAKRSGSGLDVYVADPEDQTARRLSLLTELRAGISRGELVLHYQPKVDLKAGRRTTGVEALVRWNHPTEGLLMPADFMSEAEGSELIEPLTTWVLNEALRQQRDWRDGGFDLTMAVNISARSLTRHSNLTDTIAQITETWGTPPGSLTLELTENAIIDASLTPVLAKLQAMGERLAIDDFGTGYSSLVYLQRLTVDEVKVDRSFVANLSSVTDDAVIVQSTIELAHKLGLTVVAEGVEDEAALDILVANGCDSAQGYFFSRPCTAEQLTTWLTESPFGVDVTV
jgi:diguanylate cyclase (GGDEF)-like protein/PAS domain S-box-containing protein